MADEVKDAIETSAQGPRTAEVDGVRVTQHSLGEQVAADRYLRSQETGSNSGSFGIRFSKVKPPSSLGV